MSSFLILHLQDNRDIQPSLLFKELNPECETEPQLKLDFGIERKGCC